MINVYLHTMSVVVTKIICEILGSGGCVLDDCCFGPVFRQLESRMGKQ